MNLSVFLPLHINVWNVIVFFLFLWLSIILHEVAHALFCFDKIKLYHMSVGSGPLLWKSRGLTLRAYFFTGGYIKIATHKKKTNYLQLALLSLAGPLVTITSSVMIGIMLGFDIGFLFWFATSCKSDYQNAWNAIKRWRSIRKRRLKRKLLTNAQLSPSLST